MTHNFEPVFVDATGRRRRMARRVGFAVAAVLTSCLALVGVGLFAGAEVPLTSWPGGHPPAVDAGPNRLPAKVTRTPITRLSPTRGVLGKVPRSSTTTASTAHGRSQTNPRATDHPNANKPR